ncbi:hypothetical protein BC940DRAFT_331286 [Gongronella butleri]|nr:hypothetical protein BC940DRAFT_331286 [Gongronella butleri]
MIDYLHTPNPNLFSYQQRSIPNSRSIQNVSLIDELENDLARSRLLSLQDLNSQKGPWTAFLSQPCLQSKWTRALLPRQSALKANGRKGDTNKENKKNDERVTAPCDTSRLMGTWRSIQSVQSDVSDASVYSTFTAKSHLSAADENVHDDPPSSPASPHPPLSAAPSPVPLTEVDEQENERLEPLDTQKEAKDPEIKETFENHASPPPNDDPMAIADAFWHHPWPSTHPLICPADEMAAWLGSPGELHTEVLELLMRHFDFAFTRLDHAFRCLCKKILLKAESQQLDRVIRAFAQRYWECHRDPFYRNADTVHALVYAMLLLNTDLHVVPDHSHKMTRSKFVRNTMDTLHSLGPVKLATIAEEDDHHDAPGVPAPAQPLSIANQPPLPPRRHSLATASVSPAPNHGKDGAPPPSPLPKRKSYSLMDLKRHLSGSTAPNKKSQDQQWQMTMETYLRQVYTAIKSHRIEQPSDPTQMRIVSPSGGAPHHDDWLSARRDATTSARHDRGHSASTTFSSSTCFLGAQSQDYEDLHGWALVQRKSGHFWARCFLIVRPGQLVIQEQTARWRLGLVTGNAETRLDLNHGLAWQLPPYHGHFCWQSADKSQRWTIEVDGGDRAQQWVMVLNFWAALHSVEPLQGAVTNVDYGWADDDQENDEKITKTTTAPPRRHQMTHLWGLRRRAKLQKTKNRAWEPSLPIWTPPPPPCMRAQGNAIPLPTPQDQITRINHYLQRLDNQIDTHRTARTIIDKKFPFGSSNQHIAMTNWEAKMNHMLLETVKFQVYRHTLASNGGLFPDL